MGGGIGKHGREGMETLAPLAREPLEPGWEGSVSKGCGNRQTSQKGGLGAIRSVPWRIRKAGGRPQQRSGSSDGHPGSSGRAF